MIFTLLFIHQTNLTFTINLRQVQVFFFMFLYFDIFVQLLIHNDSKLQEDRFRSSVVIVSWPDHFTFIPFFTAFVSFSFTKHKCLFKRPRVPLTKIRMSP